MRGGVIPRPVGHSSRDADNDISESVLRETAAKEIRINGSYATWISLIASNTIGKNKLRHRGRIYDDREDKYFAIAEITILLS